MNQLIAQTISVDELAKLDEQGNMNIILFAHAAHNLSRHLLRYFSLLPAIVLTTARSMCSTRSMKWKTV
jgi:hypothetical protein